MSEPWKSSESTVPSSIGQGSARRFSIRTRPLGDYQFRFQQEDLETICQDRELETCEIHPPNDYYGQATLLKEYAGWPADRPLKGVIDHAPQYSETMWDYDRDQLLPMVFSTNRQRASVCQTHARKPVKPIGFAGCYVSRILSESYGKPDDASRKGTLVVPCHSTHLRTAEYSHERYAESVSNLPDHMKPVTICMYWRDYHLGAHRPYRDRGLRVVSAGHMYDPQFLFRLTDLLRQFQYSVSNEYGTHVFLSALNGVAFSYLPSNAVQIRLEGKTAAENIIYRDDHFKSVTAECEKLFSQLGQPIDDAQRALADKVLGTEHVMSPTELRNLFRRAEWLDNYVPRDLRKGSRMWTLLPPALQRVHSPWRTFRRGVRRRLKAALGIRQSS